MPSPDVQDTREETPARIVIAGAGIVGLVLALALHKHCGLKVELYEQAKTFNDGVGAGIGMYPNGLRVIRDISTDLLKQIQDQGYPYLYRRWERHDGTCVVVSEEAVLSDDDLQPLGIRRWRLQKILLEAVSARGIQVHFNKKICSITTPSSEGGSDVTIFFCDGTNITTELLLAADGAKSPIRSAVAGHLAKLKYTGITCLYGCSPAAREARGICFPSSETTKCHGCFYPVNANEQCFQFHIPTPLHSIEEGGWGTLMGNVGEQECRKLAEKLQKDGWDDKYLQPLYYAHKAIKVPFALLEPHLESFVFSQKIVLVGDAAHPPVPYLGQGAQQGLEDAGTLALLLQKVCTNGGQGFSLEHIGSALDVYNRLRVPRTAEIIKNSKGMGRMQQKRADNKRYNEIKEEMIRRDVFFHETMEVILPGATYNYKTEVLDALRDGPLLPVLEENEDDERLPLVAT